MRHMLEQAWELYSHHCLKDDIEPNEMHWLAGCASVIGILGGTIPVGIPPDTKTYAVFEALVEELRRYQAEIEVLTEAEIKRQRGGLDN